MPRCPLVLSGGLADYEPAQGRAASSGATGPAGLAAGAEAGAGAAGGCPEANAGRSCGSVTFGGTLTGRPAGIAGMLTCACGTCGAGGVAGVPGVESPGIAGRPGIDEGAPGADEAAGAVAAGCAPVKPWIIAGMPPVAGDGAVGVADCVSPGMAGTAGDDAVAAGAACVNPGIEGMAAADAALAGEVAAGTPGKLMPGLAGAAGGVAPSAVARFCRICGALAAELISCCGMFGAGGADTGSAWAIPPVSSAADEPATTAAARK